MVKVVYFDPLKTRKALAFASAFFWWTILLASSAVSAEMLCIFASPCDALAEQSAPALLASELADKSWLDFHGLRPCDP